MLDCSQAIEMFQAAIDLDPRQYNAWWGLGDVFQRQEDFAQAKYNFLRALDINPSNQAFGLGEVDWNLTSFYRSMMPSSQLTADDARACSDADASANHRQTSLIN